MYKRVESSWSWLHGVTDLAGHGEPAVILWIDGKEFYFYTKSELDAFEEAFKRNKSYVYDKLED